MSERCWKLTVRLAVATALLLSVGGVTFAGRAVYKQAEIDAAKANAFKQSAGKTMLEALLKDANRWVEISDDGLRDLVRPVTPRGNMTTCPADEGMLECRMDDPWAVTCRKCGVRYPGGKYADEGMGCRIGGKTYYFIGRCNATHIGVLTGAAHDMALSYALTGKIEYASKTAVILARLGEVYPGFARHDSNDEAAFGAGKATCSTQAESGWLKVIVASYELIREAKDIAGNPIVTNDRKTLIEGGLLRPAAKMLMETNYGMHSIQTAQNAAVAAVGVCLDEPDYVHFAVDGPCGFRNMLANGVLDDGTWHEGAMGYHAYALGCLAQVAHYTKGYSDPAGVAWSNRAERYESLNLEEAPRLKRMMGAINHAMLADGNVPALNDSPSRQGLADSEAVAATYRLFDHWGAGMEWTAFRRLMSTTDYALLFRKEKDQKFATFGATASEEPAYDLSGFGLAVLKSEAGAKCFEVALDHSMQLDAHTHPDMLQMLMIANGVATASDYGPMGAMTSEDHQRWAARTVAHNTVVVDRTDQVRNVVPALVGLNAAGPVRTAEIDGAGAYGQCPEYRRAVLMMGGDYAVDVFRTTGGSRGEYAFHADGKMTVKGLRKTRQVRGALGNEPGFRELEGFQKGETDGTFEATWRPTKPEEPNQRGLRLTMLPDGWSTVSYGPGYHSDETRPVNIIVVERNARQQQFVSVMEPLTGLPRLKEARLVESRWDGRTDRPAVAVDVEGENWIDRVGYVPAGKDTPGTWSLARSQQGHMKMLYCTNGATATATGWVLNCAEAAIGKTGQVVFRGGKPDVLLDLPVTWGKAVEDLDVVFGEAGSRVSRYKVERVTPVGNAVWATLAGEPGIALSKVRVDGIGPIRRRVDSAIPLPRRLELTGKAVVRAEDTYFSAVDHARALVTGWSASEPDGIHPPEAPVRMYFTGDGNMPELTLGETLRVMDIGLHTTVRIESSALLEEIGPDTYRLTAPLGANVTIPTTNRDMRILWRQGAKDFEEIHGELSQGKSGMTMTVEFPIEALANGSVEFKLTAGK